MISLTNYDFQWARSELVIIYPDIYHKPNKNWSYFHRPELTNWGTHLLVSSVHWIVMGMWWFPAGGTPSHPSQKRAWLSRKKHLVTTKIPPGNLQAICGKNHRLWAPILLGFSGNSSLQSSLAGQKMVVVLVAFVVVQFVVNHEDAIGACPFDLLWTLYIVFSAMITKVILFF